jgi:hypothetical protein
MSEFEKLCVDENIFATNQNNNTESLTTGIYPKEV